MHICFKSRGKYFLMPDTVNQRILALLSNNPRGLSIKEISELISMNRNSVSGALNVLLVSGQVEDRDLGPARVFYLSNKVPISSILNISDDCIAVVNSSGNLVQVNDSCIKVIGRSRSELLDKPYTNLFSAFSFDSQKKIVEKVNEGLSGDESRFEVSVKWDSETAYFNIKVIPTVFLNGESGVIVFGLDITEKTKMVESLRISEARFRKLFEHSQELISITDENAITLWANPAWEQVFGKASKYDTNPFEKIHPDDVDIISSEWGSLVSGDKSSISIHYRYLNPENDYIEFDSNAFVIETRGDRTFCVIANPKY